MSSSLKQKGNQAFADGNFQDAANIYQEALQIDPQNSVLYSNRAMCYVKLNDWHQVLADTTVGLEFCMNDTKTQVKLLWRQGLALSKLGNISEALESLNKALELDPNNNTVKSELDRLALNKRRKHLQSEKESVLSLNIETFDVLPSEFTSSHIQEAANNQEKPPFSSEPFEGSSFNPPAYPSVYFLSRLKFLPASQKPPAYDYVLSVSPEIYSSLFKEGGLDSNFLDFFIEAVINNQIQNPDNVLQCLKVFSTCKRFSIYLSFTEANNISLMFEKLSNLSDAQLVTTTRNIWGLP
ncbi:BA75_04997T0 [Komagataella pastoris]|uniref:RNA polymerase II-associated protein 3 n=1 Tax=Komagataella pastoris TaxID=4922 RepID=A0A1B2JI22_PICPA|nr:BA75_04997T0 [Komagataella pastoris]